MNYDITEQEKTIETLTFHQLEVKDIPALAIILQSKLPNLQIMPKTRVFKAILVTFFCCLSFGIEGSVTPKMQAGGTFEQRQYDRHAARYANLAREQEQKEKAKEAQTKQVETQKGIDRKIKTAINRDLAIKDAKIVNEWKQEKKAKANYEEIIKQQKTYAKKKACARLSALSADLGGLIMGAIGFPISAVFGIAGTTANLYADRKDPFISTTNANINALTGYSLDALSLIPIFGLGFSVSKIVKCSSSYSYEIWGQLGIK